MRSASVLIELNVTNQSNAHLAIFSRSEFRSYAAEIRFSTIIELLVSSAKSLMLDPIFFTISFIYNIKSKGPGNMKFQLDDAPGRTTFCFLLEKYLLNQDRSFPVTPAAQVLKKIPWCQT